MAPCRIIVTIWMLCVPSDHCQWDRGQCTTYHVYLDGYPTHSKGQGRDSICMRYTDEQTTDGVSRYHSHRQPGKALHAPTAPTAHLPPTHHTHAPHPPPTAPAALPHHRHTHQADQLHTQHGPCIQHITGTPTNHAPTNHAEAAQKPHRDPEHAYISYLCISAQKPSKRTSILRQAGCSVTDIYKGNCRISDALDGCGAHSPQIRHPAPRPEKRVAGVLQTTDLHPS